MNSPPKSLNSDSVSAKSSLHIRQIVAGRFEVLSLLGEGGNGQVWRAHDLKLRVDVALKSLRIPSKQNENLLEAFRQEVRTAREVISPNVCRIFDLVVDDDHEMISMEYIDGITLLSMLIKKGPMQLDKAGDIAVQFLSGLEAIHKTGLVHCDLKPENIMITRTGRVVIMDFGIAKHWTQSSIANSGTLPYMSPEQISGNTVDPRSDIYSAGIVLAEMVHPEGIITHETREEIWNTLRINPRELPDNVWKPVIERAVALNPENRFPSAGALIRALEEASQWTGKTQDQKPYPGLAAFSAADSEYFLGRELEIETILKKLKQTHLMAIIGPSGAGKTSLLRAGVIPALPEDWSSIFCVPGDSAMLNLGQAIAPELIKDTDAIRKIMRFDNLDVAIEFFQQWRRKYTEALLVVDRFEELFTLNAPEVQSRYATLLGSIALQCDVRVLLCMRDDFLFRCHSHPSLAPIFSEITPLGVLTAPALRRALVQPALKCGYRFEDESLVDDILSDVEQERGALPLMAFAAFRLWQKKDCNRRELTRRAYNEIGGVAGALAKHADETMERIGSKREPIVREIFRNLVTAGNTRTVRDTEDLLSLFSESEKAEEVLQTLIDARLLTSFESQNTMNDERIRRVEIIHESLLSAWPRLVRWQIQDVDTAQFRDQLRQSAQLWHQRNQPPDLLWTGTAYREFQLWQERYPGNLTHIEKSFVQAMIQNAGRKKKKQQVVLGTIFVVLLGLVVLISGFWRKATVARDRAVSEANRAEASKILTLGRALQKEDSSHKLAFAIASLQHADTFEGRMFALQAIAESPAAQMLSLPNQPYFVAFSPDRKWLMTSASDGIHLLPSDGKAPLVLSDREPTLVPRFSINGQYVIWKEGTSTVKVWSLSNRKLIKSFEIDRSTALRISENKIFLIISSTSENVSNSDEVSISTWSFDAQKDPVEIAHWNKKGIKNFDINLNGDQIVYSKGSSVYISSIGPIGLGPSVLIAAHQHEITQVSFRPNQDQIAFLDVKGEIQIWSTVDGNKNPLRMISAGDGLELFLFDHSGRIIYGMAGDTEARVWNLNAPAGSAPIVFHHLDGLGSIPAIDYQGRALVVPWKSVLAFYPLIGSYPYIFQNAGSFSVRFTPDGKYLINTSNGICMWNLQDKSSPRTLWEPPKGTALQIDVDPTGKYILAGTNAATSEVGAFVISIENGKALPLRRCLPGRIYDGVALSEDGRFAAAVGVHEPFKNHGIELWDLQTGDCRVVDNTKGMAAYAIKFGSNNTIFSGDISGNFYKWNLRDDSRELLGKGKGIISSIATSKDRNYVAWSSLSVRQWGEIPVANSEVMLYDLVKKKSLVINSHGNRVFSLTFDPSGKKLITGSIDGLVRVGPITGESPHVLVGQQSNVLDLAVSPDGEWIASSNGDLRLWRMPKGKPLMELGAAEFLRNFLSLTNARVVADKNSATGYTIENAPFLGWKDF